MMTIRNDSTTLPVVALLLAVMLWASSFVGMKIALTSFAPLTIIWLRLVFASCVALPMVIKHRGQATTRKGDWRWLLLVAFFQPCIYFSLESYALQYTSASEAGTISAILPLMVSVLAAMFLKERLGLSMLAGVALSCGGVIWLTATGTPSESGSNPLLGNTLELGAMAAAAGYTLALRKLEGRYSAWTITGLQNAIGLVWFFPGAYAAGMPDVMNLSSLLPVLGIVAYMGVCISLGAFWFYSYALSKIPAAKASSFINLVPVISLLLGWLVLDEQLAGVQYMACVVVLFGVVLSQSGIFETAVDCLLKKNGKFNHI